MLYRCIETRAHTLPQGIWLRSRDQLKESALSFERVIMPRKSRENSVEEKRRMRNERSQRKRLLRTAKELRENRENRKQKERCVLLNQRIGANLLSYNVKSKRGGFVRTANEYTKTKERETHSSAKEIGVCLLCEMKALKQMKDHGQNQGKARLAKET